MIIDNEEVCLYYFSTSLLVICAFVIKNEYTLKTEGEGLLKTISVDLRDLLRGDYVILNYEISQFSRYKKRDFNERVDVLLNTNDNKNLMI